MRRVKRRARRAPASCTKVRPARCTEKMAAASPIGIALVEPHLWSQREQHATCYLILPLPAFAVSPEGEQWARELLAAAKTKRDLPALAGTCAAAAVLGTAAELLFEEPSRCWLAALPLLLEALLEARVGALPRCCIKPSPPPSPASCAPQMHTRCSWMTPPCPTPSPASRRSATCTAASLAASSCGGWDGRAGSNCSGPCCVGRGAMFAHLCKAAGLMRTFTPPPAGAPLSWRTPQRTCLPAAAR